jgi:hypothetical protein
MSGPIEATSDSDKKYKKEKRERALFTLKKRVEAGEVDPKVAQAVLDNYLKEPEQTEDSYFADKLREAQAVVSKLKNKAKESWGE